MKKRFGLFRVARVRGVDLNVHVALIIGFFATLIILPLTIAFVVTTIFHELGHAVMAKACRFRVVAIELNLFGGRVEYLGKDDEVRRALVAWGGILGQAVLCSACGIAWFTMDPARHADVRDWAEMLVIVNVAIGAFNLLPIPPLDGAQAWLLFRPSRVFKKGKRAVIASRAASIERELATITAKKDDRAN